MDLKATCDAYRNHAKRYMEHLHRLRRSLDQIKGEVGIENHDVDELEVRLHRFRRADCDPRYRIAFAGAFSVGKSQLINAMMGGEVLPQEIAHCTFIPTILRKGSGSERMATARYLTAPEIMEVLRYYRLDTNKAWWPSTVAEASRTSEEEVDELIGSLGEDKKAKAGRDLRRLFRALRNPDLVKYVKDSDESMERTVSWGEMAGLVTRSSENDERFLLSSVVLDMPDFALGDDVEIIDLPGTDADDPWARDITHRCVKDVDALILMVDAEKVYTDASDALLGEIKEWGGHHVERLLFVLNKVDRYGGEPADHLVRAWDQLQGSLGSRFADSPPRVFFVSAKAALGDPDAQAGLESIPLTTHDRLNELLGEAKKNGGMDYFKNHLQEFLESHATAVRMTSLTNRWTDMMARVGDRLVPASNKARRELRGGRERRIAKYDDELQKLRRNVGESVIALKDGAVSLKGSLVDRSDAFVSQLEKVATSVSSQASRQHDGTRRAVEVAVERWPELNRLFCAKVVGLVRGTLLPGFLRACNEQFASPIERVRGIEIPAGTKNIPTAPADPTEAMVKSIELRIAELLQDTAELRPYPQPPNNRLWSAYEKEFSGSLDSFFRSRTREILTSLQEFLSFYLTWHLDGFQQTSEAYIDAVGDTLLYDKPECFRALITDASERLREERMQKIVELGTEFDDLANSPLPQAPA